MGRKKWALAAMLALASPLIAADAAAEGRGITGPEAVSVMRSMGLSPQLSTDGAGDPLIRFMTGDLHAFLNFYDCREGRCGSLQLELALDLENGTSLQTANYVNNRFRYVRMHLDDEGDPFLQYDFEMLHTDHAAHLRSQLETFDRLVESFVEAVAD
ncbi:YbjN domain-containing protein [Pseudoxanthomonas koreensis]|uniref:YbjN domain-containing protein n=1 Tax=Pseudoxanthomonas koreensis TaxID=266061 RepID=UPI001391BDE4|nr:YbjN domain-containing protein [Pseudoxanthomonas koreensis]KAF1694565.1 hypothetical protein CSC64_03900 [Pseudoxanthomonas koreensis]